MTPCSTSHTHGCQLYRTNIIFSIAMWMTGRYNVTGLHGIQTIVQYIKGYHYIESVFHPISSDPTSTDHRTAHASIG